MTNINFSDYLAKNSREYKFTVKLACDDVTDEMLDLLEQCLQKYDVKSASKFKSTPIQRHPLDFPNVKNSRVFISEVILKYPVSSDVLRLYISSEIGVPQMNIAVYTENDPRETYTEQWLERTAEDYKEKYEPLIGSEYKEDFKPMYGEEYNKKFLKELEDARKAREVTKVTNTLVVDEVTNKETHAPEMPEPEKTYGLFGREQRDPK